MWINVDAYEADTRSEYNEDVQQQLTGHIQTSIPTRNADAVAANAKNVTSIVGTEKYYEQTIAINLSKMQVSLSDCDCHLFGICVCFVV
jgi:hypothetical protein